MRKLFTLLFGLVCIYMNAQITITVNTGIKKQTIRGMGCQDDLETKVVGKMGTNDDLLYDLGASSFRVFAGENSDNYHWNEPVNDDGSPNTLDLTKFKFIGDSATTAHKLMLLRRAAQRGCTFYMTIGSPPCWMKDTSKLMFWQLNPGQPKGGCEAGGKLKPTMYEEFGEFAVGVAKKFKQDVGVDLYAVTVNNEPEFTEPYYSCVYTKDEMVLASKAIAQKFKDYSMSTRIHYAEQTFVQGNVISWAMAANNDTLLSKYITAFSVHAYGGAEPFGGGVGTIKDWCNLYREANRVSPAKEVWMSEGGNGSGTELIDKAVSTSIAFYTAMQYGNTTLYSGRYLDKANNAPSYYGFKNFMRYIRPNSYRLLTTSTDTLSVLSLAFKNDGLGAQVLYLANTTASDKTVKINWSGISGKFDAFQTSVNRNCEWVGQYDLASNITLPGKSITTMVNLTSNKLPNINSIDTIVIIKNTTKVVDLAGINDGGEGNQSISIRTWSAEGGPTVFNSATVSYVSPNPTGTITLVPSTGVTGSTRLMIAVSDKSKSLDSMFNEKVISVPVYIIPFKNLAPTMNDVADQTYGKELINTTQLVTLTGVTDGNDNSQKLTLTAVSSSPAIASVVASGSGLVKITPKAEGTITVTLTLSDNGVNVGGGVGSVTKSFKVKVGSGISNLEEVYEETFIYPNPAKDRITISNKNLLIKNYTIYDFTGKPVLAGALLNEAEDIDISTLIPGMYIVKLTGIDVNFARKMIVE